MSVPDGIVDIFLQPGEFYFGDEYTRIRTLLGSCVAITVWHPRLRVGGMCHYLLPGRKRLVGDGLDGRYADEAIELFRREMQAAGTRPQDYQIKLFGGGSMFPALNDLAAGRRRPQLGDRAALGLDAGPDVASRNIFVGRQLITAQGLKITSEHLGGVGHRNIIFDVWSGDVWVRQVAPSVKESLVGQ
jgi:chemotaxis protein CheD